MPLFAKPAAYDESGQKESGVEILRRRLKTGKRNLAILARDLRDDEGVPVALFDLQNFQDKGSPLSADALRGLTKIISNGHAIYDFESDTILSANREAPELMGSPPAPYVAPPSAETYVAGVYAHPISFTDATPEKYRAPVRTPVWPPRWT